MYYLSASNRGLSKSSYCYVLFLLFKKSYKYEKYIWNINLYFFDVMKNGQMFPSEVCHFQYDHRFLFSREMGNIRTWKEKLLQKLIKFGSSELSFIK